MDKSEIITLSSDEENDNLSRAKVKRCTPKFKNSIKPHSKIQPHTLFPSKCLKTANAALNRIISKGDITVKTKHVTTPEVVDLVESMDRSPEGDGQTCENLDMNPVNETENHSPFEMFKITNTRSLSMDQCSNMLRTDTEYIPPEVEENKTSEPLIANINNNDVNAVSKNASIYSVEEENMYNSNNNNTETISDSVSMEDQGNDAAFFNEFVEFCGSLESIPNDRKRLMKKLRRRYEETDPDYVRSQDFKTLIEKSKNKLNKSNIYLIAKEITDELCLRKKIEIDVPKTNVENGNDQRTVEETEIEIEDCNPQNKKQIKIINKIVKRLDKLGNKIRELEEAEVDLSDEEDSSYIRLQRYRDRFCQVYKKLCEHTKEFGDTEKAYNRKICFTGSKYPAINKCIEKWLNKTKRFPDFNDVMKLLESQSSALELPSNRESLRAIATEIFQQVGVMLQRRRKYDLWSSFCGFLDDSVDPAIDNPELEKVLKENYENRVKKEQEIFNFYAEKQEKERLEPEEVPEEEANRSPVESGNEDEDEIECIENSINERLDCVIEEDVKENDENLENVDWDGGGKSFLEPEPLPSDVKQEKMSLEVKESKNNYKNCKSLKWRRENRTKSKSGNSEDSSVESEKTEDENQVVCMADNTKEDSKPELISAKSPQLIEVEKDFSASATEPKSEERKKRALSEDNENFFNKKKKQDEPPNKELEEAVRVLDISSKELFNSKKVEVFDIHCCQIEPNYGNVVEIFSAYDDFSERRNDWTRGKVFRDLTNINRLMDPKGKKKRSPFSQLFYHRGFSGTSWKKRLAIGCKLAGWKNQKCALSQEDKTGKKVNGEGGDSEERDTQNNSESGGDEGANFFGGSGSDEDNNENDGGGGRKNGNEGNNWEEDKEEEEEEDEVEEAEEQAETQSRHSNEGKDVTNAETSETSDGKEQNDAEDVDEKLNQENETEINKESTTEDADVDENKTEKEEIPENEDVSKKESEENSVDTRKEIESQEMECDEKETENESENLEEEIEMEPDEIKENEDITMVEKEEQEAETEHINNPVKEMAKQEETDDEEPDINASDNELEMEFQSRGEDKWKSEKTMCESEHKKMNEKNIKGNVPESERNSVGKQKSEVLDTDVDESVKVDRKRKKKKEVHTNLDEKVQDSEKVKRNGEEKQESEELDTTDIDESVQESEKVERNGEDKAEATDIDESETEKADEGKRDNVVAAGEKVNRNGEDKPESEEPEREAGTTDADSEDKEKTENEEKDKMETRREGKKERVTIMKVRPPEEMMDVSKSTIWRKENSLGVPRPVSISECRRLTQMDLASRSMRKRKSTSDEERVKQFLLHSPSSISITPPKKLSLSKPPSQAALQALATLRNLKGISATRVRKPRSEEDVVVIGESHQRQMEQQRRSDVPIISNVTSIQPRTPKIVTVQGNAPGFGASYHYRYSRPSPLPMPMPMNNGQPACNMSSIRISNVWGNLPDSFYQSMQNNDPVTPSCSTRPTNPPPGNVARKKTAKKTVEYVVLD